MKWRISACEITSVAMTKSMKIDFVLYVCIYILGGISEWKENCFVLSREF